MIIYLQQPGKLGLPVRDVTRFLVRQRLYDFPQGGERQVDALALRERRPGVVRNAWKVQVVTKFTSSFLRKWRVTKQ